MDCGTAERAARTSGADDRPGRAGAEIRAAPLVQEPRLDVVKTPAWVSALAPVRSPAPGQLR
ncbi:hypothetical protein Ae168Ps1_3424 [Pseudonocardia sp. Ae168_Ps1]|nr:hypothetical protein Ae168Ps1_3424 [Pseudonocardia sp. Ae168_Ps1]